MTASAPSSSPGDPVRRGKVFRYESCRIDANVGLLSCRYSLDGRPFEERVTFSPAGSGLTKYGQRASWDAAAVPVAARLIFLLAGVSYYKTMAPPVIDLGNVPTTDMEREFLREFYLYGLGEFAYRNGIDLSDLRVEGGGVSPEEGALGPAQSGRRWPEVLHDAHGGAAPLPRVLIPFGGGIDSIVTVETLRRHADAALFVLSLQGEPYDALEPPAAVTGLPVVRAGREIDPQILRSRKLGFLRGHVPMTGILSAIAIMAAVLADCDAVAMSNEWSASAPTLIHGGRPINHQYSKSAAFEAAFRGVLAGISVDSSTGSGLPDYFSALRHRSELWIAKRFAELDQYHRTFRSCNKSFHITKARRLDHWCGRCDKCCFTDLILAPFMPMAELAAIFDGREPLADPSLAEKFRTLLGVSASSKPFECVGEVGECRTAALLAARRPDRTGNPLLQALAATVSALPDTPDAATLLRPVGKHFIPNRYATDELVN